MNHKLWTSVGARVIAVAFVIGGVTACDRNGDVTTRSVEASPSAQVIGVAPAPPTGDPSGTTPVAAANTNGMSTSVESQSMPLPGQANDHSNVAKKPSQNAESQDVLKSTETAQTANSEPSQETRK